MRSPGLAPSRSSAEAKAAAFRSASREDMPRYWPSDLYRRQSGLSYFSIALRNSSLRVVKSLKFIGPDVLCPPLVPTS